MCHMERFYNHKSGQILRVVPLFYKSWVSPYLNYYIIGMSYDNDFKSFTVQKGELVLIKSDNGRCSRKYKGENLYELITVIKDWSDFIKNNSLSNSWEGEWVNYEVE
jgi:hypothetical protein